ncbi:phospholipase A2 [Micromonospora sp. NPDC020750]|uniref:phospholipase A2 n=1 Tax=unclassified Micromonospora TaxID=2617518 RepID=UPI0037A299F0
MRTRLTTAPPRRSRTTTSGALVALGVLLVTPWTPAGPAGAAPAAPGSAETTGPADTVSGVHAEALRTAATDARRTGLPVIVPAATTATSITRATPDGKLVTEITTGPVRARGADGSWTLIRRPAKPTAGRTATAPSAIDPPVALPLLGDTDVNSNFDGNNADGEYLKAGTEADGEKARAYLAFDTRGLQVPTKAELTLTNVDAPGCGATVGAGIQVRRVTDFWDPAAQTWTPQPTSSTTDAVLSREGSQLGSCGSGRMSWDVTGIVAQWAAGTAKNHGLVLQAPSETRTANYRVFTSAENTEELGPPPTLTVTSEIPTTPGEGDDPADPGPAPADQWPGLAEPETGSWVTRGSDVTEDGLLTVRSHSAGQRIDLTNPNESVLGPNWRLEPLGGMLGNRLKDYSANGYLQVKLSIGTQSLRFEADPARPGTFVAQDGGTVVRNADGSFTQSGGPDGLTYVWRTVGADRLITSIGDAATGTVLIGYDAQGRISRITAPASEQDDCTVPNAAGCASATFGYATSTTATATQLGDVAGQLKQIDRTAAGATTPVTVVRYAYDQLKRLREVRDVRQVDGDPVLVSAYTYDTKGNITRLNTPQEGAWTLTYAAPGKLSGATADPAPLALPTQCRYATQYLLGQNGCWAGPVPMEYGGRKIQPSWKRTPTRKAVVGVTHDHCTSSPDRPSGFDFRSACDAHDYGYGIIYLKTQQWDKSKKASVDAVFYSLLRDHTCPRYNILVRANCRSTAYTYYTAVRLTGGRSMKYRSEY